MNDALKRPCEHTWTLRDEKEKNPKKILIQYH